MTSNESLALFLSFITVVCLTLQSAILVRDLNIGTTDDEPWQRGLGARLITLLVLWGVWIMFTISYIPWGDSSKKVAQDAAVTVDEIIVDTGTALNNVLGTKAE